MSSIADIRKPVDVTRNVTADFLALTKPRIALMVLITTAAGYLLAGGGADPLLLFHTLIGTALAAGGASALNMLLERQLDAKMERTSSRPLPSGRLHSSEVVVFGIIAAAAGVVYLAASVNLLTSLVAAFTVVSYVCLYTPLKTRTSLSTVVGAVPGALPPIIGWVAVRNSVDLEAMLLFSILFMWQLPHFLAIAWKWRKDYHRAGFPLLPVLDPEGNSTARQVLIQSFGMVIVTLLPSLFGLAGAAYFFAALVLGAIFLVFAAAFSFARTDPGAHRLFLVSIVYLPLLLASLTVDKILL